MTNVETSTTRKCIACRKKYEKVLRSLDVRTLDQDDL